MIMRLDAPADAFRLYAGCGMYIRLPFEASYPPTVLFVAFSRFSFFFLPATLAMEIRCTLVDREIYLRSQIYGESGALW